MCIHQYTSVGVKGGGWREVGCLLRSPSVLVFSERSRVYLWILAHVTVNGLVCMSYRQEQQPVNFIYGIHIRIGAFFFIHCELKKRQFALKNNDLHHFFTNYYCITAVLHFIMSLNH